MAEESQSGISDDWGETNASWDTHTSSEEQQEESPTLFSRFKRAVIQYSPRHSFTTSTTQSETQTISKWWKYMIFSMIIGPIMFFVTFGTITLYVMYPNGVTLTIFILSVLIAIGLRLLLPFAIYKDAKVLSQSYIAEFWRPSPFLYLLGTFIVPPPMEYMAAARYLYFRHKVVGIP